MTGSLDGIISRLLDAMQQNNGPGDGRGGPMGISSPAPTLLEGIIVDPGSASRTSVGGDCLLSRSSYLSAVAEVVSHSRPESVSDRVARMCLRVGREHIFSNDETIREAAARVIGNTLNAVGDADDASNIMREVVLNMGSDEGSSCSAASTVWGGGGRVRDNVKAKHGKLLACSSILSTQWGQDLMSIPDICDAIIALIHACVKDKLNFIRSAAYHVVGPILGNSNFPDANGVSATTATLKELRSDVLKGTRLSEDSDVQLALARGLTSASRMNPNIFLCKAGMPILDAALMVAMSSSFVRSPHVQKAFQIFLWVALQMGSHQRNNAIKKTMERIGGGHIDRGVGGNDLMSPGLEKYMVLAEENGRIMLKFVSQTLASIEDVDLDIDQG